VLPPSVDLKTPDRRAGEESVITGLVGGNSQCLDDPAVHPLGEMTPSTGLRRGSERRPGIVAWFQLPSSATLSRCGRQPTWDLFANTTVSVDPILFGLDRQIQANSGDLAIPSEQIWIY